MLQCKTGKQMLSSHFFLSPCVAFYSQNACGMIIAHCINQTEPSGTLSQCLRYDLCTLRQSYRGSKYDLCTLRQSHPEPAWTPVKHFNAFKKSHRRKAKPPEFFFQPRTSSDAHCKHEQPAIFLSAPPASTNVQCPCCAISSKHT